MRELFPAYYSLNEDEIKLLWEKCLFVLDTNVLLDLYRLPISASSDLLKILKEPVVSERLWIPFQAAIEYQNNRLEVIEEQKNKYGEVKQILEEAENDFQSAYSNLNEKLRKQQLKKRHSKINPDKFINDDFWKNIECVFKGFVNELNSLEKEHPDVFETDKIRDKIDSLLCKGKIGEPPTQEDLNEIYKEGEERYENKIPPGFEDKKKKGYYTYNKLKLVIKYGDLIFWKQIIAKAKNDNIKNIILVTGETKPDWWLRKRGKTIGPHRELIEEIKMDSESVSLFHMYNTHIFMKLSEKYLGIKIKPESIEQVKDIKELSRHQSDMMSQYYKAEQAVFEWLKEKNTECVINHIEHSSHKSPDFILTHRNGEKVGYEIKYVSANTHFFLRRYIGLIESIYQSCQNHNDELDKIYLVIGTPNEDVANMVSKKIKTSNVDYPAYIDVIVGFIETDEGETFTPRFMKIG